MKITPIKPYVQGKVITANFTRDVFSKMQIVLCGVLDDAFGPFNCRQDFHRITQGVVFRDLRP